jgi:hypothetical protein
MIAALPSLAPLCCPCCDAPYTVRAEHERVIARCPAGAAWGGEPTSGSARVAGCCKGCLAPLPKGKGRPREWCEDCLPPKARKSRRHYARTVRP